ncbi:phosphate signaling complex protein PhoU [Halanaerobiaceae bacterium Z-7014]|uniref:Phosphate-specific transport system accessory protein PhoU n=1 Tax=Halonatronomonas betaini TaxID=2778430 RepID=A0A931ASA0_9FIRM|nr:phosphate signaling complex protein PhoU [Halonatronomonas betaini]MBF8437209.1 phosphate signaling complex protein PhoU [Halonatronomonas betaini]
MRKNYQKQLDELKDEMLIMAGKVEEAIWESINALQEQDLDRAKTVIANDDVIDELEMKLEEMSTRLIALQQPVAGDLRTIIVISKLATDLERIGDHAVNIAEKVLEIGNEPLIKPLIDIPKMTEIVTRRLKESLDAFIRFDSSAAREIAREDEEVDKCDESILTELLEMMAEDSSIVEQATSLIFISRFLERIGDHSTNICERVIYMDTGKRETY